MSKPREHHWDAGRRGEDHALSLLSGKGFRLLHRNYGRKILRLQRLAQRYCWQNGQSDRDMRFDVVGVEMPADGAEPRLEHIPNAFMPDGAGYFPSR
jgi:Holliday junction resolvase-like predicted endonuclease